MKSFLPLSLALFLPLAAMAEGTDTAPDLVISSGIENGGYWTIAETLREVAAASNISVKNERSSGSVNNLRALMSSGSPVNLAFAQADAVAAHLKKRPDDESKMRLIENIGLECVFIVTDPKKKIKDDEDLQEEEQLNLGIRSPNSGIRVTFEYMATLVPELQDVTMTYGDTVDALDYLRVPRTDIEAVMFVHGPNEISPEMLRIQANPDDYRFVELKDERFLSISFKGQPIYQVQEVTPALVDKKKSVETICVQGLLVANADKLTPEQLSRLITFTSENWEKVHLKQKTPK